MSTVVPRAQRANPDLWHALRSVLVAVFCVSVAMILPAGAQGEGRAAYEVFMQWKKEAANAQLEFGPALTKYRERLKVDAATDAAADRTIRLIAAHSEGELYDRVYSEAPTFNTEPNQLLLAAVSGVPSGKALDVGMGNGRNALHLARQGWDVTGFDVAAVGLKSAREQATAASLALTTVLAADEEFDFGRSRWDLIVIIYALEKRSVHRVRDALKPGGLVIVEAGHTETSGSPFEYRSNELLEIFQGFRILQYEDTSGKYDWGPEQIRLVRLVAQKPQ
jgi:2-polyprenyl-3-methyl-5-hydroxy-6-metoxy-1,4-benzoquinol methylase